MTGQLHSALLLIACGNQMTRYGGVGAIAPGYSLSGSSANKAKAIKTALESANATAVVIESGMSNDEKLKADAEVDAILATLFPSDSAGVSSSSGPTTDADMAAAAAKAGADVAAKAAADAAAQAASAASAQSEAESVAKAAADAAAQKALASAAAAKSAADAAAIANPSDSAAAAAKAAADAAVASAQTAATNAAAAATAAAAQATADAQAKANADASAKAAAAVAAKAQVEAAAKAAAKRAYEREEDEKKKRSEGKSKEEEQEDRDDDKDFADDGSFETAVPRVNIGDDAVAFREACAQAMKVDKKKLVIASDGSGKLENDSVLVVFASGGSITVKPEGEKFRGLCIFSASGATVSITAGKTRFNGLFVYERGNNNKVSATFSDGGRFKSGVVIFSGSGNAISVKGVNDCKCKKLKVYGSAGIVDCGKR